VGPRETARGGPMVFEELRYASIAVERLVGTGGRYRPAAAELL